MRLGLITCFHRSLNYCVLEHAHICHSKSQALIIYCKIDEVKYVIINSYFNPAELCIDLVEFLAQIKQKIIALDCNRVIWCGDFNTTLSQLDLSEDREIPHHKLISKCLNPILDYCDFTDIFRLDNPTDKHCSYIRKGYGARLDYMFASLDVVNRVKESEIGVAYVLDHAPVYTVIDNCCNPSGHNYWKFPNYLVHCNEYIGVRLKKQYRGIKILYLLQSSGI